MCATDDTLFYGYQSTIMSGARCSIGAVRHTFTTPASPDGLETRVGLCVGGQNQLFGTSTIRKELEEKMRRRGLTIPLKPMACLRMT